jgi:hypothetical protein
MPPTQPRRAANYVVDTAALYAALTTAPARADVAPILVARTSELLRDQDRSALATIDPAWMDIVQATFAGLIARCPLATMQTYLDAAYTEPNGITARRMRFQLSRVMPPAYGGLAFAVAGAMVRAAAEVSRDPDVVAALTPPTVTGVVPLNGATGVAVGAAVTATFSVPMDPATITPSSFILANPAGAPVQATVAYDAATRQATLTPSAALTAAVTYTARLKGANSGSGAILDSQGTPLSTDLSWTFTT